MNVLALIAFIVVEFFFLLFAILIIRSGLSQRINRSFLYFLIAFALWGASNYASNLIWLEYDALLFLNRFLFFASIMGLVWLLYFIIQITHQKPSVTHTIVLWGAAIAGSVLAFLPETVTGIFIDGSAVGVDFGSLSGFYFGVVVYLAGAIIYRLMKGVHQRSRVERGRAKVLFVSIGLAVAILLITNALIPLAFNNFAFSLAGLFAGIFIIGGVSYGIVRHGMFDIKRAAVRSVAYSLVLLTLALLYAVMALGISAVIGGAVATTEQLFSGVVISLTLALVFQPIKQFFDKVTNRIFYKSDYRSDVFYARLNQTLVSTTDLRKLLERTSTEIANTLKSDYVSFIVHLKDGRQLQAGTTHYARIPADDKNAIMKEFKNDTRIKSIQTSMMEKNVRLKRLLLSHRIELVMALRQGDEVVGLLCLGEHLTSVYTPRDVRVLTTISDELVIAIQNALSVQALTELNAHLQQRIDAATKELRASNAQLQKLDEAKDEFISMASHQLRTPLTSIKGYISMLVEGDVGAVTKEQKHLLEEAFVSSERMVRLIGDFLNVSRLQTGKFVIEKKPVNLAALVASEIEALESNAATRNLKFVYKRPAHFPELMIDENKFQQVIMNFADNAIYYSKEGSKIAVGLREVDGFVEFTVKDTGIGVPAAQQDQLFSKFFRATNARQQRPDGTGVGLFLAKKVIDAHGGTVVFESKEGKGSTFGFRLPVKKLQK